jgi:hypothetical protein
MTIKGEINVKCHLIYVRHAFDRAVPRKEKIRECKTGSVGPTAIIVIKELGN